MRDMEVKISDSIFWAKSTVQTVDVDYLYLDWFLRGRRRITYQASNAIGFSYPASNAIGFSYPASNAIGYSYILQAMRLVIHI